MMVYEEDGSKACQVFMDRHGLRNVSRINALAQAAMQAIPTTRGATGSTGNAFRTGLDSVAPTVAPKRAIGEQFGVIPDKSPQNPPISSSVDHESENACQEAVSHSLAGVDKPNSESGRGDSNP